MTAAQVIAAVSAAFVALLVVKRMTGLRVCAVCAAVSLTWGALLVARAFGAAVDPTLLGVLLGGSAVGIYYLAERRSPERFHVFRLPFLMTLMLAAYAAAAPARPTTAAAAVVVLLWAAFGAIFAYRAHPRLRSVVAQVIACCRDW